MSPEDYQKWLAIARRFSRTSEAEDLLHDALLVAVQNGRIDLSEEENRRWFTGVLRNQAAMTARSVGRRKKREHRVAAGAETSERPSTHQERLTAKTEVTSWLDGVPPAARCVLVLALHGLDAGEIRSLLDLTDTAFRQRLTTARRALARLPDDRKRKALEQATARRIDRGNDLDLGLIRKALIRRLRMTTGDEEATSAAGVHDPDGHLLILAENRDEN